MTATIVTEPTLEQATALPWRAIARFAALATLCMSAYVLLHVAQSSRNPLDFIQPGADGPRSAQRNAGHWGRQRNPCFRARKILALSQSAVFGWKKRTDFSSCNCFTRRASSSFGMPVIATRTV